MFKNKYPLFVKKHILKIEMLENMRDFPRNIARVVTKDFCDGILCGCNLESRDQELWLTAGCVIHSGILYMMEEDTRIQYTANGETTYLKVRFLGKNVETEEVEYETEMALETTPAVKNELELARFKLQPGARLRSEYTCLEDYNTEYDTVNRLYAPYASINGPMLYPSVLYCFAERLWKLKPANSYDIHFCMTCLNNCGMIGRTLLSEYVKLRSGKALEYNENLELYQGLLQILDNVKSGHDGEPPKPPQQRQVILM